LFIAVIVLGIITCKSPSVPHSSHSGKDLEAGGEIEETRADGDAFAKTLQSMVQLDGLGGQGNPFMVSDGFSSDGDSK
jgi:hypothetical protein